MASKLLLDFAIVGIGGAIGAMSRFAMRQVPVFHHDPYYFTVIINVTGCLIMGVLWALFSHLHFPTNSPWCLLLMTGVLGGYTTYSAFTVDAMTLVQNGMPAKAFFYIAITFIGGLGACWLGLLGTERICRMF